MEKKYQIFISSTYEDLKDARRKVQDAILSMYHFPVGMELFGAADDEQWEIIKETIDSSDFYVLIIAHRYGSVIPEGEYAGISYTEKEFRYAKEVKIPILVFIIDDSIPVPPGNIDKDSELVEKLKKFKEDAKTGRTVVWWKSTDDLAQKVTASLYKEFGRKKRPGWVRSDEFDIEKSHAELLRLNNRVRELEEENGRLRSQIVERKPKLKLRFLLEQPDDDSTDKDSEQDIEAECRSHGDLLLQNNESGLKIRFAHVNTENYRNKFAPLTRSDVSPELRSLVSDKALQSYNNALPETEEIDHYINNMEKYQRIHSGGIAFNIQVANDGTCVAHDVRVNLEFPDEFLVFEVPDVSDVEEPEMPPMPKNPIQQAEREYARRLDPMVDLVHKMALSIPNYSGIKPLGVDLLSGMNLTESLYVDGHTIDIKSKQIQHYDLDWFRGIYVVPLAKGKYQIHYSIMCSEYTEPDIGYLTVEVVQ